MATGIFSAFNMGGAGTLIKLGIWVLVFLFIGIILAAMVFIVLIKKNQTRIIELDLTNKRVKQFTGRARKNKRTGVPQLWVGRIKRWLPQLQQKDLWVKGKQDVALLVKDNNGMYHTARLPKWEEIKKYYRLMYKIDLAKGKTIPENKEDKPEPIDTTDINNIYLLPNPHEDLDWLAGQIAEADKEFKDQKWWQHPNVMIVSVAFICFIMFIATIVLSQKM